MAGRTEGPTTPIGQSRAHFSLDCKWLVWASEHTGQSEIFVQSFPPAGVRYQVSNAGGMEPQWRGDGQKFLFPTLVEDESAKAFTVIVN